jgi:hypothetical protein
MNTPVENYLLVTVRQASKLIQPAPNSVCALIKRPKTRCPAYVSAAPFGNALRFDAPIIRSFPAEAQPLRPDEAVRDDTHLSFQLDELPARQKGGTTANSLLGRPRCWWPGSG